MIAVMMTDHPWLLIANAIFLGFVMGQVGFLMHDAGHHQIFSTAKKNAFLGYISTFLVGVSLQYWVSKHNEHHAHPNREDMDPDIDVPVLAFSPEQASAKRGWQRFFVKRQHWFFFLALALAGYSLREGSIRYCLKAGLRRTWLDLLLIMLHFALVVTVLFLYLPWPLALAFFFIHELLAGLYMGMVFAPNHKGMPILKKDEKIDFLREQVLTARNVRSHPVTDFLYGGLNYQVEHHLFPHMPRPSLRKANSIVRDFCIRKGIPYHETSILQSYREIIGHLREVAFSIK